MAPRNIWKALLWMALPLCAIAAAQNDGPREPLCRAALAGDLAQVRQLLEHGADPNVREPDGQTPLMLASSLLKRRVTGRRDEIAPDYPGVATLLLNRGADVNARNREGSTALLLATDGSASEYRVVGADEPLARLLAGRGANVNARDNRGWTPLLNVAGLWTDHLGLIRFLVAAGADVHARLPDGRTAVMLAARLGKAERLALLLDKGADVNAHDTGGTTALMEAAMVRADGGAADTVTAALKLLTSRGAHLNAKDKQGRTAAGLTASLGHLERAQFLLDRGTKVPDAARFLDRARGYALICAVESGTLEAARSLLDRHADPNFRYDDGRTPLMMAAAGEYAADKLMLLLERGANPNAADPEGNTVLMRAAAARGSWQEEEKPLIHLLLEKNADPHRKNMHGVTALMLMAREGNPAVPQLLERNVDVNARDDRGNTALLYAARFFVRPGNRWIGAALLDEGADVNAANDEGETALILAATQYELDGARLLLAKGADVHARTGSGRTALMQAIDGPEEFDNTRHVVSSPGIAKLLIASGADVNARDAAGNTPLKLALSHDYLDLAAALRKAGAKE